MRRLSGKSSYRHRENNRINFKTDGEGNLDSQAVTLNVNQQKQILAGMKNLIRKLQAEYKTLKTDITDCQCYS